MKKNKLLIALSVLAVSSCAQKPKPVTLDPIMVKINASAEKIHKSVTQLEKIKQATNTLHINHYRPPTTGALSQLVTIKWSGNAEQALKALASMVGYTVKTSGLRPTTSPIVIIDVTNKTAFSVLEDIGWQAGGQVGISVDEDMRHIMIVYKGR